MLLRKFLASRPLVHLVTDAIKKQVLSFLRHGMLGDDMRGGGCNQKIPLRYATYTRLDAHQRT